MSFTVKDLVKLLQENFNDSTIVEEIVIVEDGISVCTDTSFCLFDVDHIKNL